MRTVSKLSMFTFLPIVGMLASCGARMLPVVVDESHNKPFYGVDLLCKNEDMVRNGYEYGDIVKIKVTKDSHEKEFIVPYVTNYNEAGTYGPCLCDYESKGNNLSIATGFKTKGIKEANYFEGGKAEITMYKDDGFRKTRSLARVTTKLNYQECGYDNMKFANCRDVITVGNIGNKIKRGVLYRGSSPICDSKNKDRYNIVDKFMEYHTIIYDVSLSLSETQLEEIYTKETKIGKYTKEEIHDKQKLKTVSLGSDFFRNSENQNEKLGGDLTADVFNFIAGMDGGKSVLVHCNEGKDRTGFIIMVLEALCGVSLEDLVADYMLTFCNYYNITEVNNKEKYDVMADLTCYRNLYSFMIDANDGNDRYNKLSEIDMLTFKSKEAVLKLMEENKSNPNYIKECAEKYLLGIGVTKSNIEQIESNLRKENQTNLAK